MDISAVCTVAGLEYRGRVLDENRGSWIEDGGEYFITISYICNPMF